MAASGLTGDLAMTMVGRAIGVIVLCFLAGLLLSRLGITARGILTDTWATILSVFVLLADWMQWALPYILLGAVVVVPLFLLATLQRFGNHKEKTAAALGVSLKTLYNRLKEYAQEPAAPAGTDDPA